MLCEEFNRVRKTDPAKATTALIAAMIKHATHCSSCRRLVECDHKKAELEMTPIRSLLVDIKAAGLSRRVMNDPEALATIMEKPGDRP